MDWRISILYHNDQREACFLRTHIHLEPSFNVVDWAAKEKTDIFRRLARFFSSTLSAESFPILLNASILPSFKKIEEDVKALTNDIFLKNEDLPFINNTKTVPMIPASSFKVKSDENHQIPVHYYKAPHAKGLLLYVHGGPHAYLDPGNAPIDILNQALLQQGYSYARLEPRGSTGDGHNHTSPLVDHWNDVDVKDVMTVASYFKNASYQSIFLAGESYGGFLTAAVMGKNSSFFKGAVPIMGIYDWGLFQKKQIENTLNHKNTNASNPLTQYLLNSIAYPRNDLWSRRLGFEPLQDKKRNREVSPIYGVEHITCPILLIHGNNDTACDPGQFLRYFHIAKHHERDITGILIHNAGHNFNANEMTRTYAILMVDWFDAIVSGRYKTPDETSFFEMKNYTEDAPGIIASFRK